MNEAALVQLLQHLKEAQYHFTVVTPSTHAKVLARPKSGPLNLRDIFGWNRPFDESDLSPALANVLRVADAIDERGGQLVSKVRVASLGDQLLLHGAFPTSEIDSVFFGPDTYRFARFLREQIPPLGGGKWLVDMGAGSGAGAIVSAGLATFEKITMVDVNSAALRLAAVNAAAASVDVQTLQSNSVPAGAELVIANPPYMIDPAARAYRDGGGLLGGAVALDWVSQALAELAPGGTILLYTGAAYVDGEAPLIAALERSCADAGASLDLDEIDPDVFGEDLEQPQYAGVERIAAIGAVIKGARKPQLS